MMIFHVTAEDTPKTVEFSETQMQAYDFLQGVGVAGDENADAANYVTRAEFAAFAVRAAGMAHVSGGAAGENMYLGYTNKDAFEEEWKWISDEESTAEDDSLKTATPFHDVSTEHKYWSEINNAALNGFMTGSDGYFRPDEYVTVNEAVKVAVKLLGAEFLTGKNYPVGYVSVAASEGLLQGIKQNGYDTFMTKGDLYVLLENTLTAKRYEAYSYKDGSVSLRKTDEMLISETLNIYKTKGMITANDKTNINSSEKTEKNSVVIDGEIYRCSGFDRDDILGFNVTVYYKDDDVKEIVYVKKSEAETLTLKPDDIVSYKNYTYVTEVNDRQKTYRLNPYIDVIYNGCSITDFTSAEMNPKNGMITFIDNDNDGTWDLLKITSYEIMVVDGADVSKEILYGKTKNLTVLDLTDGDYFIYDKNGSDIGLSNINEKDILEVYRYTKTQGEQRTVIKVVTSIATGAVSQLTDDGAVIEGVEYETADMFEGEIKLGSYGAFYLNGENKIVYYDSKTSTGLKYAYLVKAHHDDAKDTNKVRIYRQDGVFTNYELAKNVKVNDKTMSAEKAIKNVLTRKDDTTQNQIICFELDNDEKLKKILTRDMEKEGMYRRTDLSGNYSYRITGCFLDSEKPAFWVDDNTVAFRIPRDASAEENYSVEKKFENDGWYTFNEIYTAEKDAIVAGALVNYVDSIDANELKSDSVVPVMISGVQKAIDDNREEYYLIRAVNGTSNVSFRCKNSILFDSAADLEKGDIARIETSMGEVSAIKKVYDIKERRMVEGKAKGAGTSVLSECSIVHGFARSRAIEGGYFTMNLCNYTDGKPNGITDKIYSMKTSEYVFVIYDTTKNTAPHTGSVNDIVFSNEYAAGDELVIHHVWATGRTVFIIK